MAQGSKTMQKTSLQRPKGTQDILPAEMPMWHQVENTARKKLALANYHEIRTPIFEYTDLFERGVGDTTDIVNKEMYTFEKGERRLTLRPENTAGVVRAFNENGMSRWPKPVKLFYIGPMFRYERPQAGRQRQFHQLGVECFGLDTPASDAEVIQQAIALFETLGLKDLALEINNIGCLDCRDAFKSQLKALVQPHLPSLCESCQERYNTNPLRMLDCKVPTCQAIYNTPDIAAFLNQDSTCEPCQTHYVALKTLLSGLAIPFAENKKLVRGLDYYTRTVFEVTCRHLGAQNAVCGGGRYNHLVEELGGQPTPAVGWAVGLERLTSLLEKSEETGLDCYIVSTEALAALKLAHAVREQTGLSVDLDLTGKGFGKQLAQADKLGARYALILGEEELAAGTVTLKDLKAGTQATKTMPELMQGLL
jgi:histidyl-tRNA synthetase